MVKCMLCEKLIEDRRSFTCKRCGKSPCCLQHLDREYRVCSGCAAEERIRLRGDIMRQARSVKGFLRFTQFVFILAALFFALDMLVNEHVPEVLRESVFFAYVFYWGGAAVAGMVLCYVLILSQQQKRKEIEEWIQSHKAHSRYFPR